MSFCAADSPLLSSGDFLSEVPFLAIKLNLKYKTKVIKSTKALILKIPKSLNAEEPPLLPNEDENPLEGPSPPRRE